MRWFPNLFSELTRSILFPPPYVPGPILPPVDLSGQFPSFRSPFSPSSNYQPSNYMSPNRNRSSSSTDPTRQANAFDARRLRGMEIPSLGEWNFTRHPLAQRPPLARRPRPLAASPASPDPQASAPPAPGGAPN